MASLTVAGPEPGRISQILPAVKCSTCHQPVPIHELGEHICSAPPPMPAASSKPPMSPTSASFFQQKYQKLIASQSPTIAQSPLPPQPIQDPPRAPSAPPRQGTPLGVQRGQSPAPPPPTSPGSTSHVPRQPSVAPLNVPKAQSRPERVPSPLARSATPDTSKVVFPSRPEPSDAPARPGASTPSPSVTSPLSPRYHPSEPTPTPSPVAPLSRTSSEPARFSGQVPVARMPPGPTSPPATAPPHMQAMPIRAPSAASMRSLPPGGRQPAQSSPPMTAPLANTAPLSLRPRAATAAPEPEVIYSTSRATPAPQAGPSRGPPLNLNVNVGPQSPPGMRGYGQQPSIPIGGMMSPQGSPSMHVEMDTKTGGEAGMAGVGRRGFAAAARAAMFAHQVGMHNSPQSEHPLFNADPQIPGMDGRRANAPRYLDIASANHYNPSGTPPLSAGSTTSPHSPRSGGSPHSATIPSPSDGRITPTQPAIARTPSPLDRGLVLRDRVIPPAVEPPKAPLPATPSTPSLPFFEKFKNKNVTPVDTSSLAGADAKKSPADNSPLSPDESEFEGLAYADDSEDEDNEGTVRQSTVQPRGVRFPSMRESMKSESKYSSASSSAAPSPRLPARSLSTSTTTSSYTVRTAAKSTGALDRAMETLFEEDATSPTASSVSSPAVFPMALAQDNQRDSMRPKLPTRAHTSPGLGSARPESKRRAPRVRSCLKCEKTIEDGRWIHVEGGGVMCDRCWKNMYLPKCRRCNQTIEKHAVSSSDGQLKGKYHRDCFNCHTCHKPFPDKTFYVFDGKPFCAYHYHEANRSLCAAATCGQPIEGPCAVSSSGDRYHPEHFLCEHPRCAERLVEYWDVDGRMFCDKHAQGAGSDGEDGGAEDSDDEFLAPRLESHRDSMRATKRKTVFIDLAVGAGAG